MSSPMISAVCCTYKRFTCVERVINCFINQTYPNKELIVYNTDSKSPYIDKGCSLLPYGILFINVEKDSITHEPYTNVGAIRRDALMFATGKYVVTWDDDDIFLPWFMQQAIDKMEVTGLPSFKPAKSFFHAYNKLQLVSNTMEASVVADRELVRHYGYLLETATEGLGWYTKMRDRNQLIEDDQEYLPSYCFNWQDGILMKAVHKQSGDVNNPDNFENHKLYSADGVDGRCVSIYSAEQNEKMYKPYIDYIQKNRGDFPSTFFDKYLGSKEYGINN